MPRAHKQNILMQSGSLYFTEESTLFHQHSWPLLKESARLRRTTAPSGRLDNGCLVYSRTKHPKLSINVLFWQPKTMLCLVQLATRRVIQRRNHLSKTHIICQNSSQAVLMPVPEPPHPLQLQQPPQSIHCLTHQNSHIRFKKRQTRHRRSRHTTEQN